LQSDINLAKFSQWLEIKLSHTESKMGDY